MNSPFLLQVETESVNPIGMFFVWIFGCALYLLPAIIGRKKRNSNSITLLNLFLGWTLLGWVVALVWATKYEAPLKRAAPQGPAPSVADELHKLHTLHEMGALSEKEYSEEKQRLLRGA